MVTHHFLVEIKQNLIGEFCFVCDCGQQGRWCFFSRKAALDDHLKHKAHQRRIGNMAEP